MFDRELMIMLGAVFLVFTFSLFLIFPSGKAKRRKPRKRRLSPEEQKDWHAAALRMEKHIVRLKKELFQAQKVIKKQEIRLDLVSEQAEKVKDKLAQERSWQKKEADDLDKKNRRLEKLQNTLCQAEEQFEEEHQELLRLQRRDQENTRALEQADAQIKQFREDLAKARAQSDNYRQEILDLRSENKKLSRKHEDTEWIAKSEFLKVRTELQVKSKELERYKRSDSGS
ncbi:MAG: hypothetical protein ACLFPX_04275 [Candidatus Omnitrophota bacterium]